MNKSQLKAAVVTACLGAVLAICGLLFSFGAFVYARHAATIITLIAPPEHDRTLEFVEPLLDKGPHKDAALAIIQSPIKQGRTIHQGWLEFARTAGDAMRTMCFIWAGVGLAFLSLLNNLRKIQRAAVQRGT